MSTTKITAKAAHRSKKYRANLEKIEKALGSNTVLPIEKALEVLIGLDQPKFAEGASIELHVKLNINPTRSDQLVRGSVVLPHGTGKKVRIAAFVSPENVESALKAGATIAGSEDLIDQIKNTEVTDFDISIAQPEMMKKLPSIAKILGTRGLMPNPKSGTVGDNIEEMIRLINAGKLEFKNDKSANLHIACGKINSSFDLSKLTENVTAALEAIEKAKPEAIKKKYIISAHLAATQSPSIKIM
jgi:large subunit ribosomal protein L1